MNRTQLFSVTVEDLMNQDNFSIPRHMVNYVTDTIKQRDNRNLENLIKLLDMVLNINENNTVDFNIGSDVCIGQGYLQQMKELSRDIIGDIVYVNKE